MGCGNSKSSSSPVVKSNNSLNQQTPGPPKEEFGLEGEDEVAEVVAPAKPPKPKDQEFKLPPKDPNVEEPKQPVIPEEQPTKQFREASKPPQPPKQIPIESNTNSKTLQSNRENLPPVQEKKPNPPSSLPPIKPRFKPEMPKFDFSFLEEEEFNEANDYGNFKVHNDKDELFDELLSEISDI